MGDITKQTDRELFNRSGELLDRMRRPDTTREQFNIAQNELSEIDKELSRRFPEPEEETKP